MESDRITKELCNDSNFFDLSPTPSPPSPLTTPPSHNDLSSSSVTSPAYLPIYSSASADKNLPSSSVTPAAYPPTYQPPSVDGTVVYPPYIYPPPNEPSSSGQQFPGAASNFLAPSFLPPSMLGVSSQTVSPVSPSGMQQVTTQSE